MPCSYKKHKKGMKVRKKKRMGKNRYTKGLGSYGR